MDSKRIKTNSHNILTDYEAGQIASQTKARTVARYFSEMIFIEDWGMLLIKIDINLLYIINGYKLLIKAI